MKNILLFLLLCGGVAHGQITKYGVHAMDQEAYAASVAKDPSRELVNLATFIPGIILDIRYATTNNFTKHKIYNLPRAYARRGVAEALKRALADFQKLGYNIKVYDGYRPYAATVMFYEVYHDTTYVASPYKGSRHNRGCALDMTLVDARTGQEIPMPTEWDSFHTDAWPDAPVTDPVKKKNRQLLIEVMQRNGFTVYEHEWWHFDFVGWQKYEVLDIPFEELR